MRKQLHFYFFLLLFVTIGSVAKAQVYDQTTPYQQITTTGQSFTFSFTGFPNIVPGAYIQHARLHVIYEGDFGDGTEFITVTDQNAVQIGQTVPSGFDCAPEADYVIELTPAMVTGIAPNVNYTLATTFDVDDFCTNNRIKVRLEVRYCNNYDAGNVATIAIPFNQVCPGAGPVMLGGTPQFAMYSGTGVMGNEFDPSDLAAGEYTITMSAMDDFGCMTTDDTVIKVLSAPMAVVPNSCSTFTGTLVPTSGIAYSQWHSDAALTNLIVAGQGLSLTNISNDTTFYLSYLSPQYHFTADTFTLENAAIADHDEITGDDRGGIAVTNNYVYINGDDSIARYDLNLGNGINLPGMDGLFTDLATNQLYTLYNTNTGNAEPVYGTNEQPVFNAIRRLNEDLTFSDDSIMLDRTFVLNLQQSRSNGMYAGAGYLIIYSYDDRHCYRIDLYTGASEDLGMTDMDVYGAENWAEWGMAEYDGTNYSIIHRSYNDYNIERKVLPNGPVTTLSNFTNMEDMSSIIYSSSNNRWYFHYESSGQLGGVNETLGYADATADTTFTGVVQGCARPINILPDTSFNFTLAPVKATGNCNGTTALMGSGIMVNGQSITGNFTYQWLANNAPVTDGGAYSGSATDTLHVSDTTGLIGTVYTLIATNACGFSDTTEGYTMNGMIGNTWSGTTDSDWDDVTNWSCGEIPTATTLAIIPTVNNHPVINIPNAICGGLEIHENMEITFAGTTNQLEVLGDVYGEGELFALNGNVLLSGEMQQDLYDVAFGDVEILGGGKKVFHESFSVVDGLTLTNGVIEIKDILFLYHPDQQNGGDVNSFIVTEGEGAIVGMDMGIGGVTAPVTYHIGINENSYTPVTVQNEGDLDMFAVSVKPHVYDDGYGTNPVQTSSPVVDRTWMIEELTPGGSFAKVTPQWNAGDEINGFDLNHVYVAHYMNGEWTSEYDSAFYAPPAAGTNPYTATMDSITSFSPFAVASNGQFPLTITLLNISAVNAGTYNKVNWNSSTEHAGDVYELERSTDGKSFGRIATIAAKGKASSYTYPDESAVKGINYYRVKMMEANGKFTYSKVVSAVVNTTGTFGVEAYPNPVKNTVSIKVNGTVTGKGNVTVSDITGKVLATAPVVNNTADINMSGFASGMYIINYSDDARNETMKINKQ